MKLPIRPRRLRTNETLRRLVAEHSASVDDLIEPLFVVPGTGVRTEISSMPGVFHQSVDSVVEDAKAAAALGIPGVLLFGLPPAKDEAASWLDRADGPVQQAIEGIKRACPDLLVAADLCACEYTSHGHCGIVDAEGRIDNDRSVELLARGALSYARSGADFVAPSDMMDGRVGAIRSTLDEAGFSDTAVMSYAVKYASAFYGPFREAADSTPAFGDRRTHQMDPANVREAVKEALLDEGEGADVIIVKPALAYLDVVRAVREAIHLPLAVYNVSGEYSMVKAAVAKGYLDEERTVDEMFVAFKRAGADIIVTYFARAYAARRKRR
jgi:porphobilinogen synthase